MEYFGKQKERRECLGVETGRQTNWNCGEEGVGDILV